MEAFRYNVIEIDDSFVILYEFVFVSCLALENIFASLICEHPNVLSSVGLEFKLKILK